MPLVKCISGNFNRVSFICFDFTKGIVIKILVVEKEVKEETGFTVTAEKNIAVQDWRKHNVMNYAYGVIKIFVMCKYESGKFEDNIETTQIAFFDKDSLPEKLAVEKCTKEQVLMCFKSYENHELLSYFD